VFLGVEDGERVIAKSKHSGGDRWMRKVFTEDDSAVAKMEAVKKAEGEVPNEISLWGGGQRIDLLHVRRMREISGSEMRWRAR
jgi:hypothetical protein